MLRFRSRISTVTDTDKLTNEQHPAFRLGTFLGSWLTAREQQLANWLNQAQHRISFQLRNILLGLIGLFFLLYFIALLT
ncbi:hypothetical protein ACAW74_28015 [Fibrella sp. WM1]|uniref:Uncharacterized protein n=1 Tax=Spirosoma sordidisoli TaxID=2502893 RepID=A0A4Q2UC64_9BACT|nr:hypothetical protein [Spirosoma sordidisoli]RYC66693.1 hypothetical protein EQG79_28060 [Spirosoma sordidisoli]